jgi:hypothetical protein
MDIPKDEWPFTRHALQWICFHQNLYQDRHAMSLQILLTATELSTCREVYQEIDLEYNAERLRNMLGCLVNVDEDNLVFLAHYTVKEYLESQRTSRSATSYLWTGQESMMKECMRTILQEAQAVDWPEGKAILLQGDDTCDTPDAFLQDFVVYCVVSGSMLLVTRQNVLASDELLLQLAVDFVNPSLRHYHQVEWISGVFQTSCAFFSEQNRDAQGHWHLPLWNVQPDCIETAILLHFMLLSGYSDLPMLAHAFSKGKEVGEILQSHISISMRISDYGSWIGDGGTYEFDGSLLEVMAQLSSQCGDSFVWLLDQCDTAFDTSLLQATVGFHTHFHDDRRKDRCALQRILSGQADPNAAGYLVTPLQIAVATSDAESVTELLDAGADSNATGDQNGIAFKTNSVLETFNDLHGLSPLHICRVEKVWVGYRNRIDDDRPVIEALLLQHGARAFSSVM